MLGVTGHLLLASLCSNGSQQISQNALSSFRSQSLGSEMLGAFRGHPQVPWSDLQSVTFSGGGTGGDSERVQGGSGDVSVQRQPQHQNGGAGLRDGHQVDQAGPQSQGAGRNTSPAQRWRVRSSSPCVCVMGIKKERKQMKTRLPPTTQAPGVYRAELW